MVVLVVVVLVVIVSRRRRRRTSTRRRKLFNVKKVIQCFFSFCVMEKLLVVEASDSDVVSFCRCRIR